MKIISVNQAQTKGLHDVAFNMDKPVDAEVLRLVKMANVFFSAEGDVLKVRVSTEQPITATSIAAFQDALNQARALKTFNEEEAARKRERMLQVVGANTGLTLN